MKFGTPDFDSINSLEAEEIQKEAASAGMAESFTESGPQVRDILKQIMHLSENKEELKGTEKNLKDLNLSK